MDSEEAPPPYSAVDPLVAQSATSNGRNTDLDSHRLTLRGGNAPLSDGGISRADSSSSVGDSTSVPSSLPANFLSATAYFTERPPSVIDDGRAVLEHHLTIYPRSQSKDFPRRPRCWSSRNNEITQQDWDTFLRYLFPPQLGLASTSGHLPRQLRAEIQRDRKDRPQETDEQREKRVRFVIAEWNQYFFRPRGTRIVFVYVVDPERAPSSSLCPRCYPAATRASQDSRPSPVPRPSHWQNSRPNLPSTLGGQPTIPPAHSPFPNGAYAYPPAPMTLPFPPYGMPPIPPAGPPTPGQPRVHPPMPPVPPNYCHWGWNNRTYSPQPYNYSSSKSGPLGWISQIASQAQKYGERITEQAEHYGRQMEEQAMAHGRWIEEQAGYGGQKVERFGDAISNLVVGRRDQWTGYGGCQPAYPLTTISHPSPPPVSNRAIEGPPQNPSPIQTQTPAHVPTQTQTQTQSQPQRPRRSSTASTSSESSLTSIDSISTTSDLSSSDLATVRAQLLSLDDHHDRNLYDAAVGLRRQLDALQESRRQARFPGQGYWRNGWWYNHPHSHGGWGRWESPQQQQQNWVERQARKEEMRTTKKVFRDVLRRAREEQREKRRLKRNRRRQERKSRKQREEQAVPEVPLEQRLQNLELENHHQSQSVAQPTASRARSESISSAAPSEVSIISTPSTTSSEGSANPRNGQDEAPKDEKKQAKSQTKDTKPQPRKEKDDKSDNQASSTGI